MTFGDPDLQGEILEVFAEQLEEFRRGVQEDPGPEAIARCCIALKALRAV